MYLDRKHILSWNPESLKEFPVSIEKFFLHHTDSYVRNDRCFLKLAFCLFISCWSSRGNLDTFSPSHFPFPCSILPQHHTVMYCSSCSKITSIPPSLVYCFLAVICIYSLGNWGLTLYGTFWAPSPITVGRQRKWVFCGYKKSKCHRRDWGYRSTEKATFIVVEN